MKRIEQSVTKWQMISSNTLGNSLKMLQNGVKMMCIECYFIFKPTLLENHWLFYVNPDATVNFESCSLDFLGGLFFDN
jgi:hypothetical protein